MENVKNYYQMSQEILSNDVDAHIIKYNTMNKIHTVNIIHTFVRNIYTRIHLK